MATVFEMGDELTVVSLNLWGRFAAWQARREQVVETLRQLDADVLLLQECHLDEFGDQALEVARALGIAHVIRSAPTGEAVAIASRLPIDSWDSEVLPGDGGRRRVLQAIIRRAGRILNTHLAVAPAELRREQLHHVVQMADGAGAVLLGGDLNSTWSELRPVIGGLDAGSDSTTWTWPEDPGAFRRAWRERLGSPVDFSLSPRRIDWILTRGHRVLDRGTTPVARSRGGAPGSDHRAVHVRVRLSPSR